MPRLGAESWIWLGPRNHVSPQQGDQMRNPSKEFTSRHVTFGLTNNARINKPGISSALRRARPIAASASIRQLSPVFPNRRTASRSHSWSKLYLDDFLPALDVGSPRPL